MLMTTTVDAESYDIVFDIDGEEGGGPASVPHQGILKSGE